ncbi:MAG: sulfate adenylyltransferase [Calditrichaeota bacterium]|nr:sulfate adenylyltransferase [Calditrichota bacterium]
MIKPHGGTLINRYVPETEKAEWMEKANTLPRITLDDKNISDLEMIASGAMSPLTGFMTRQDYETVVRDMRLSSGLVWSIPITLAVDKATVDQLDGQSEVALVDGQGRLLAVMQVEDVFTYDKEEEARQVFRTTDEAHPGVAYVYQQGEYLIGGPIFMIQRPQHTDFVEFRLEPAETRQAFAERGWETVVAFQTRNPIHRAHEYLQKCALEIVDGLLIHPLVGRTKADDIPAEVRMKSYLVLLEKYYPRDRVMLSVFPAAMRYAGPREAIFHALVRKNYGCTHIIIGRDHAGVGNYYGTYDAQHIFREFKPEELDITPLFFEHAFYCKACGNMASAKTCPHDSSEHVFLSGTKVRAMLANGELPPKEFTRPEVARILMEGVKK